MTEEDINSGLADIRKYINEFVYTEILEKILNDVFLIEQYNNAKNNYEKLHIFRILFEGKHEPIESDVIRKFVNEAFHIENDYIYQISPMKFQLVPHYIIDVCDSAIKDLCDCK